MALALSGPVGDKNRKTVSDPKTKKTKFKPVKNAPADVELVRLMLKANGYTIAISTKVDAAMITMIRDFQKKKLGYKKPDGIVDPAMGTWNAGLPKLAAQVSADAKIEVYQVVEGGKTKFVSKAEYEAGQKALKKEIMSKARVMKSDIDGWISFCEDIERIRQATHGYLDAFIEFSVSMVNDKTDPPWDDLLAARSQASAFVDAVKVSKPNWQKVYDQDKKTTKAHNKALKAFKKFIKERIKTASAMVGNLEVIRDTAFSVVEAYITAKLVVTKGMTPAKANAIAAASTEALKSGAGQLGEYVSGNNVTLDSAAKKIFIDSFIAGLAGAAGGKLGGALADGLGKQIAKAVLPKLSGNISKKAAQAFFQRFLDSKAGQAMVVNALKEVIGLFKPLIEKGRAPNMKEIKTAVAKVLTAGILDASAGKALQGFSSKFPSASADFLKSTLGPKTMAAMRADLVKLYGAGTFDKLAKDHGGAIFETIGKSLTGKWIEKGVVDAVTASDGSQSAKQMQKLANDALRRDEKLRKKIESMIKSEIANKAKQLEKAK